MTVWLQDLDEGSSPAFSGLTITADNKDALVINHTGTGFIIKANTSEFVINDAGRVGIGTADPKTKLHITNGSGTTDGITIGGDLGYGGNVPFQIVHGVAAVVIERQDPGGGLCPELTLSKTKGSWGAPASVAAGNCLAKINFNGYDGNDSLTKAVSLIGEVGGGVSTNIVPGIFRVEIANTAGVPTERLRIDSYGYYTLGKGTKYDGFITKPSSEITTADAAQTTLDFMTLLDENTYHVEAYIIGVKSDGSERASYHLAATVYRTGAGSATIEGSVTSLHTQESDSSVEATFTVSGNDLRVSVTGIAAETWEWGAIIKYSNMSN